MTNSPRITYCSDCERRIWADDDPACVCIQCGGRNRRLPHDSVLGFMEVSIIVVGALLLAVIIYAAGMVFHVW